MRTRLIVLAAVLAVAAPAFADSALGTFTVAGKTERLSKVYASLEQDPTSADRRYLMLLVADVEVAPADRTPDRLLALAKAGRVHALRLRWTYGTDTIVVTPYHQAIAESGRAFARFTTLDLTKFDDKHVDAEFKSKMLGQTWFFNAVVKADIARGGVAVLEPEMMAAEVEVTRAPGDSDTTALKRRLGGMGYAFNQDAFFQAIGDHSPEAVDLFLQAGMSPNAKNDQRRAALNHAVLLCGHDPVKGSAVVLVLVRGKADLKSKDPDNQTTPLVGAVQSCSVEAVDTLVKAGSDLTAKSAGGATALQLAEIYQRQDVAAILKRAGAK